MDDVMESINSLQANGITVNYVHHRFALAWFSADLVARAQLLRLHGVRVACLLDCFLVLHRVAHA